MNLAYPIPMPLPIPPFVRYLPFLLMFACPLWAGSIAKTPQLTVDLVAEPAPIVSGKTVTVALRLIPVSGWHIYWKNPGDSGLPPSVTWKLPAG